MPRRSQAQPALRYAVDEADRLVTTAPARSALSGPVRILEGAWSLDRANRLAFHAVLPPATASPPAPHTVHFEGTWTLTKDHSLALTLHEAEQPLRQTIFFKGALLQAEAHALIVTLRRGESTAGRPAAQQIALSGRWRADDRNRLTFLVEKGNGAEDRLTFQGAWELGERHELRYRYRVLSRRQGRREEHVMVFAGAWQVAGANRLVYRLSGSSTSAFEFTASLQSASLLAREGRLAYHVGITLSRGVLRRRVTLFGAWKLSRTLAVSFEVPYADGRVEAIRFEGSVVLSKRDRVAVALSSRTGARVGLTVIFTRELFPDASLFLRLQQAGEERAVIAGVQVKF